MDYYSYNLDEQKFTDMLSGLVSEILLNMAMAGNDSLNTPSELSPIITRALDFISDNLSGIDDVRCVSDYLHITESYFFKLFKTQLKTSPKKYINSKRLLYAQKMIRKGKKPTEIYPLCGFESYVGFYKQYVKEFGYPPSKEKVVKLV